MSDPEITSGAAGDDALVPGQDRFRIGGGHGTTGVDDLAALPDQETVDRLIAERGPGLPGGDETDRPADAGQ